MRFNLSTIVLAVAASTGVMAAPVAEPGANAHTNNLERRGVAMKKLIKNPLFITALVSAGANVGTFLRLMTTNLGPDDDITEADIQDAEQQQYNQIPQYNNNNPGVVPLVPANK